MKTRCLGLVVVVLLTVQFARAQAPDGTFSFDFTADNGPLLWNVTGVELFDPPMTTVDHQDSFGILWSNRWPVGRIFGDGTNTFVRAAFRNFSWEQQGPGWGGIGVFQFGSLDLTLDTSGLA